MSPPPPVVRDALEAACRLWGVPPAYLLGRSRSVTLSARRQAVWAALRAVGVSLPTIAAAFDRDTATVLYGVRAARARPDYAAAIAQIVEEARCYDPA